MLGTRSSIETAKTNIQQGLTDLEECIYRVKQLDKTLSAIFDIHENHNLQADLGLEILTPENVNDQVKMRRFEKMQKDRHIAIRSQLGMLLLEQPRHCFILIEATLY